MGSVAQYRAREWESTPEKLMLMLFPFS